MLALGAARRLWRSHDHARRDAEILCQATARTTLPKLRRDLIAVRPSFLLVASVFFCSSFAAPHVCPSPCSPFPLALFAQTVAAHSGDLARVLLSEGSRALPWVSVFSRPLLAIGAHFRRMRRSLFVHLTGIFSFSFLCLVQWSQTKFARSMAAARNHRVARRHLLECPLDSVTMWSCFAAMTRQGACQTLFAFFFDHISDASSRFRHVCILQIFRATLRHLHRSSTCMLCWHFSPSPGRILDFFLKSRATGAGQVCLGVSLCG